MVTDLTVTDKALEAVAEGLVLELRLRLSERRINTMPQSLRSLINGEELKSRLIEYSRKQSVENIEIELEFD